jgi:hypothetical protein
MVSAAPATAKTDKPSFAKVSPVAQRVRAISGPSTDSVTQIAATGLKPPSAPSNPSNPSNNTQKHTITSAPRAGTADVVAPSNGSTPQMPEAHPSQVPQPAAKPSQESESKAAKPEVHVHTVEGVQPQSQDETAASGLLAPTAEDSNTQDSSSSGSVKPPSLDGKSVASGTTFALDEKESLRPDDSASAKAADDEDVFSAPGVGVVDAGSESDVRAFRDQLREISSMEPPGHNMTGQTFAPAPNPPHGMLYIPPHGPGIGTVPGASGAGGEVDYPPHPKLIEALTVPQDRIWVLKLEQDVSDFVRDPKEASLNLPQCNSYQRMLAHKIADYYRLGHVVDESNSSVRLFKTPYCRLPPSLTGITTPSTAASTPPPSGRRMKILRRGEDAPPAIANGSGIPSKSASETDGSDNEKKPKPVSYEERLANYESVRLRIMGSAKPSETGEEPKTKEGSRSSSAAGKKPKKKQRADSDDGFDTRSAYNTYNSQQYGYGGTAPTSYAYAGYNASSGNGNIAAQPTNFNAQPAASGFQGYAGQVPGNMPWTGAGYTPANSSPQWPQGQQPGYDLSPDFQRAMSFQTASGHQQPSVMPTSFDGAYNQQFYGQTTNWSQQQYQMNSYGPQAAYANPSNRPASSAGAYQDANQPYAYGQLPSQTFPGRPPSKLEHPLPGSYKGKHFNPQSQAFVPGQQGGNMAFLPFTPQNATAPAGFNGGYAMPSPLQRQASSHSSSAYGSPHQPNAAVMPANPPSQPMMHPLPQPVFPQQPSPNVPLPPKPVSNTPQKPGGGQQPSVPSPGSGGSGQGHSPSSIAKWGTPASLPAKPPPPAEPFDPARFQQMQQQRHAPAYNTAATARIPGGGMPNFGSMPQPMGGNAGLRS